MSRLRPASPHRAALAAALALVASLACRGGSEGPGAPAAPVPAGTPVDIDRVTAATMLETVSAPGQTVALVEQKVRAPFAGRLTALEVVAGDRVAAGQRLGTIVARDSEAALEGAREMLRQAKTPREKADARRALELAQVNRVASALRAGTDGVVARLSAAAGDRVGEGDELLALTPAGALVFAAQVAQSDLPRIRPGQPAAVELADGARRLAARVRGLLAAADPTSFTAPVRLDLDAPPAGLAVGLFGTARITVGRRRDVPVVPLAAVLRDDVGGVTRVAKIGPGGRLHWVEVTPGLEADGRVEVASPELAVGDRVVVSGQVGLPEGAPLVVRP